MRILSLDSPHWGVRVSVCWQLITKAPDPFYGTAFTLERGNVANASDPGILTKIRENLTSYHAVS